MKQLAEAGALLQGIHDSDKRPAIPDHVFRFRWAGVIGSHGHALEVAGDAVKARTLFGASLEILKELAAKRPGDIRISDALEAIGAHTRIIC